MKRFAIFSSLFALLFSSCGNKQASQQARVLDLTPADTTSVKHPEWTRDAVIYEVNMRQYSEDASVKSFAAQLDRLSDLGVDILWFMPVHPISQKNRKGTLGSYYAVKDYKGFNPEYGTIEEFKELVDTAHQKGFKVILDWVANHTGCDNAWVAEHPDWYVKDENGNMVGPYDWTDTYKLDYSNPQMRAAMIDALKFWVEEIGVDGYRCDVAGEVPTDFWVEARQQLQAINPDIFMLAEASKPELEQAAFDAGYNWPMKDLWSAIAATSGQYSFAKEGEEPQKFEAKTALDIDSMLMAQAKEYPGDSFLMNMTTNHDLNSWEGTEFDRLGNLQGAFAVLMYTLPGMPMLYTGQETGMDRAFEFFEKDKAPEWEPRNEYFEFYRALNALKHSQPALKAGLEGGDVERYDTENPDIYAFSRTAGGKTVTTIVNLGSSESDVKFTGKAPALGQGDIDIFTGEQAQLPASLAPGAYFVAATK
ncbi:MAG: alpha-amylase family glycosyl hydrolase [Clostridium sp.]|nr:alpha-amylase family glycosyl hydrolase [Clostridium sp.]